MFIENLKKKKLEKKKLEKKKFENNYIYLTVNNIRQLVGSNHYFANLNDVILAYNQDKIELHSNIWVRSDEEISSKHFLLKKITLGNETVIEYYLDKQIRKTKTGEIIVQYIKTTAGKVILNNTIQKTLKLFD